MSKYTEEYRALLKQFTYFGYVFLDDSLKEAIKALGIRYAIHNT